MRLPLGHLAPCLPAVLLLLFAGGAGTLAGAASAKRAIAGHLCLLLCLAFAGRRWRDPLGLGPGGGFLLAALLISIAASWLFSPVARAGRTAILLLPAFLLLPGWIADLWSTAERRRTGTRMVSLAVAAVAAWALIEAGRFGGPAAAPLGHHNLLAAWLVTLLQIALVPWRDGQAGRWTAGLAGALGLAALLASSSLGAALAAAVLLAAAAWHHRRRRFALLAALLAAFALLAPQLPRLARIADDSSLRARLGYLEAGARGLQERTLLGWGPGSTAWTIGDFFRPQPGVHPADEMLADLHCLPLQLAYELGVSGLLLIAGLGLVFWRRQRGPAEDPALRRAGLLGLGGLAVVGASGLPLTVTALPVAAAVAAGGVLAASSGTTHRGSGWPGPAAALLIAAALLASDLAHLGYDRAAASEGPEDRIRHLRRATELDPSFPLYRARLAWNEGEIRDADRQLARRALQAAEDADGLAPLWLVAGVLANQAGGSGAREALLRACRLSPLGALAPFHLATAASSPLPPGEGPGVGEPGEPLRVEWGARAILAEPRLLAATAWPPRTRAAAAERAVLAAGLDPGWRQRLTEIVAGGFEHAGPTRELAAVLDAEGSKSFSLHAFRRRPWPVELTPIEIWAEPLARFELASAAAQSTTAREVFASGELCLLGTPAGGTPDARTDAPRRVRPDRREAGDG